MNQFIGKLLHLHHHITTTSPISSYALLTDHLTAWTALATEGLGCNLQHFHPGINRDVAETWNVPHTWRLTAQLVFGKPAGPPRGGVEKTFAPLERRVKVYGSKN
jgi:predicted oxidoreductase (fatty acid repression mutant protein)